MTEERPGPDGAQGLGAGPDGAQGRGAGPDGAAVRRRGSQLLIGFLCALLGFALVVQLRQAQDEDLSSLRQEDLVRLLDEVTRRGDELAQARAQLASERAELLTSEDSRRVAEEAARQRAQVQGVLAGTVPVEGPGITVTVVDLSASVQPHTLYSMLQELRNAGAEAIEISGQRLTASSWFSDAEAGVTVDGTVISPPYRWVAIGDPQTLAVALEIPGGALAGIRNDGGEALLQQHELTQVAATRDVSPPRFATPAPTPTPNG